MIITNIIKINMISCKVLCWSLSRYKNDLRMVLYLPYSKHKYFQFSDSEMIEDFGWLMSRVQMNQTALAEASIPSTGRPRLWPGIQKISACLFHHASTADPIWIRIPDQWVRLTTGLGYLEASFAVLQSKHCLNEGRMLLAMCVCAQQLSQVSLFATP